MIEKVNHFIQPILWGWPVLICILLAGILFTVRLRFFQFTKIGLWMKLTFAGMFRRKKQSNDGISPFQALTTALAGSIGTGNIVGVATALTLGGPGAIFWMWISALLGMMTIYAETVLGMKYRKKDKNGKWLGGAMYYIEYGLKCKPLAIVSRHCPGVRPSFAMGNMAQANATAGSLAGQLWRKHYNYGSCYWAGCIYYIERRHTKNCKGNGKSSACYGGDLSLANYQLLLRYTERRFQLFGQIFSGAFNFRVNVIRGTAVLIMLVALRSGVFTGDLNKCRQDWVLQ